MVAIINIEYISDWLFKIIVFNGENIISVKHVIICVNNLIIGLRHIRSSIKPTIAKGMQIRTGGYIGFKLYIAINKIKNIPPPLGIANLWELLLLGSSKITFWSHGKANFVVKNVRIANAMNFEVIDVLYC